MHPPDSCRGREGTEKMTCAVSYQGSPNAARQAKPGTAAFAMAEGEEANYSTYLLMEVLSPFANSSLREVGPCAPLAGGSMERALKCLLFPPPPALAHVWCAL